MGWRVIFFNFRAQFNIVYSHVQVKVELCSKVYLQFLRIIDLFEHAGRVICGRNILRFSFVIDINCL
jgi:hypothetical protein